MAVNSPQLMQKQNILACDFQNTQVYALTHEGQFLMFKMDSKAKTLKFEGADTIDKQLA